MTNGLPFIGDEVRLRIQVEAYLPWAGRACSKPGRQSPVSAKI